MARLCANLASCHGDVCFSFAFRLITDADSNESYEPRPAWAKAGLSIPSLGVRESKQVDCYILSFLTVIIWRVKLRNVLYIGIRLIIYYVNLQCVRNRRDFQKKKTTHKSWS